MARFSVHCLPRSQSELPLFFFFFFSIFLFFSARACLGHSVTTIDANISTRHIAAGIGEQEGHRAHEVLRLSHLALGNERSPLLLEVGVLVEDLLGAVEAIG